MNIENVNASNYIFRSNSADKTSANAPKFSVRTYSDDTPVKNTWDGTEVPDPVRELEKITGQTVPRANWTVTEEEAAELREKYGDTYDESTVYKLYDELVEKGVIDSNFFTYASGYVNVMPVTGLKVRGFLGMSGYVPGYDPYNLGRYCGNSSIKFNSDEFFVKDVSRTDKNAYKSDWESFKSGYDREINTWQDALQENIDFTRYLKEIAAVSTSGKHYPSAESLNREINGLEKVKDVIFRIFG